MSELYLVSHFFLLALVFILSTHRFRDFLGLSLLVRLQSEVEEGEGSAFVPSTYTRLHMELQGGVGVVGGSNSELEA